MTLSDIYEFYMYVPDLGLKQVYPVNKSLQWQWSRDEEFGFYRQTLETNLVFVDDDTNILDLRYDFSYIYNREKQHDRCAKFRIDIHRRCGNDPFALYFSGYFTVQDCTFDVDKCKVEVEINPDDDLSCLTDNWDEKRNLLEVPSDFVVGSGLVGVLQTTTPPCCSDFTGFPYQFPVAGLANGQANGATGDCLPSATSCGMAADGWVLLKNTGNFQPTIPSNPAGGGTWNIRTTYVREYVASSVGAPTADPSWIDLGGNEWARPVAVETVTAYDMAPDGMSFLHEFQTVQLGGDASETLQNGRYLTTVLDNLVHHACNGMVVRSDFLDWNADATAPSNTYYDAAAADYHELAIFPTHDIVKTNETESSFNIDDYSLKDILEALQNIFNLHLIWDGTELRLEHLSYIQGVNRVDLTIPALEYIIKGKWQYEYDKGDVPRKEVFEWAVKTDNDPSYPSNQQEFDGAPIYYDPKCSGVSELRRQIGMFVTNLDYVINNGVNESNRFYESTIFLLASTEAGAIKVATSCLPPFTQSKLNMPMGWPCLHERFWKYGRPQLRGTMNGNDTVFDSTVKIRTQADIHVPMCCEDFALFRPEDRWKTQMGWGEVDEATYDDPISRMTLRLRQ